MFIAERFAHDGVEEVLQRAVAAGGDTDTIASMTGHIVGAHYGLSRIEASLVDRLEDRDRIIAVVQRFGAHAAAAG